MVSSFFLLSLPAVILAKPFLPRQQPGYYSPPSPPVYGQPSPQPTYPPPSQNTNYVTSTTYETNVTTPVTTTIAKPNNGQPGTVLVELPISTITTTIYDPSITTPTTSTGSASGQPTVTVTVRSPEPYITSTSYIQSATFTSPVTITRTTFNANPLQTGLIEVDVPVQYSTSLVYDPTIQTPSTSTRYTSGPTGVVIISQPQIYTTTTSYVPTITAAVTSTVQTFAAGPPLTTGTIAISSPVVFVTQTSYDPNIAVPTTNTRYTPGESTGVIIVTDRAIYSTTTVYRSDIDTPSSTTLTEFSPGPPLVTGIVESDIPIVFVSTTVYSDIDTATSTTVYTGGPTATVSITSIALYSTTTIYGTQFTVEATSTVSAFQPGPPIQSGLVEVDVPVVFVTVTSFVSSIETPVTSTAYSGGPSGTVFVTDREAYSTRTSYGTQYSQTATETISSFNAGPPLTTGLVQVDVPATLITSTSYVPSITAPITVTDYTEGASTGTVFVTDSEIYITTTSFGTQFTAPASTTLTPFAAGPPVQTGLVELDLPPQLTTTTTYINDPAITAPVTSTDYTSGASTGVVSVTDRAVFTTTTVYGLQFTADSTSTIVPFNPGPPIQTGTVEVDRSVSLTTTTTYLNDPTITAPVSNTDYTSGASTGVVSVTDKALYSTSTVYGTEFTDTRTITATPFNVGPPVTTGLIIVDAPATYTTVVGYYSSVPTPITTTIVTFTGGSPGTVLISSMQETANPVSPTPQTTATTDFTSGPTGPVTTDSSLPTPTACVNQGLAFAVQDSLAGRDPPGSGYPSFIAEEYKNQPVLYSGITNTLGGINVSRDQSSFTLYNQYNVKSTEIVINHQAYLYAPVTGRYTFATYHSDDIVMAWVGGDAYSGWVRNLNTSVSNANLDNTYQGNQPVAFDVELEAGKYYPFRFMYGQGFFDALFQAYIFAPDGTELLGPDTNQPSPYILQFSCPAFDGTQVAPPFPPFPGT